MHIDNEKLEHIIQDSRPNDSYDRDLIVALCRDLLNARQDLRVTQELYAGALKRQQEDQEEIEVGERLHEKAVERWMIAEKQRDEILTQQLNELRAIRRYMVGTRRFV